LEERDMKSSWQESASTAAFHCGVFVFHQLADFCSCDEVMQAMLTGKAA
jgi:hypothetical protein